MDMIGRLVVAGNVRRSALLALGNYDDEEFINLKNWQINGVENGMICPEEVLSLSESDYNLYNTDFNSRGDIQKKYANYPWSYKFNGWRWASNNTVYAKPGQNYDAVAKLIAENGEPGLFWIDTAKTHGRLKDGIKLDDQDVEGVNPCITSDTLILTTEGLKTVEELIGTKFTAIVDSEKHDSTDLGFWRTGTRDVYKVELSNGQSIKSTSNHKFLTNSGWKELNDLNEGDSIKISKNNVSWEGNGTYQEGYAWEQLTEKEIFSEKRSYQFIKGLLQKLFDNYGSVVYTSICIKINQDTIPKLILIQKLLLLFNIQSTIESFNLLIINNDIINFKNNIAFLDNDKNESLNNLIRYCYKDNSEFISIKNITHIGKEDVFDCTIPNKHCFSANGIISHNCSEIQLESYETCNLSENYPVKHENYWDLQRTLKFSYLYSKAVTLLPTEWKETNSIIAKNRRIGCSISGIQEAIVKFGRVNFFDYMDKAYEYISYVDKKYSDWLGVPRSIRRTTVKPSGTVSILAGSLPGIHHPESTSYYRTIRVASNSDLVEILRKSNYRIEPSATDPEKTVVVYFPVIHDERHTSKKDVSIWRQFKDTRDMQHFYCDNMVSVTITFNKNEVSQIADCLSAFDKELKSVSLLPLSEHGYIQAPYIDADRQEIIDYANQLLPLDFSVLVEEDEFSVEANKFCEGEQCQLF